MPAKLVEATVKFASPPASGSTSLWDADIAGFGLRVHAKGTKSFFFSYTKNGLVKRISIGKWPAWTALRARERAKALRATVDSGSDPAGEKRERREAPTIRDLVERYKRDIIDPGKRSRPKDEKRMLAEIEHILGKDTKVADVHFGDMEALHRKITYGYEHKEPRPVRANRILAAASKMFTMSLRPLAGENKAWRSPLDGNPCKGVPRNHEEEAGRLYTPAEMDAIADALANWPGEVARDCIKLIAFTGCRPIEAKRALWSEFDKEPGFWCKPSAHTKQKRQHRVPLSVPARMLIEQLRAKRDPGKGMVFPGRTKDGTVDALQHCWHYVRRHAGLGEDCRLYDLRHSFASIGAGSGLSLLIIGKLLGHTTSKTTERYAQHLADDPLQTAVDKIADRITGKRLRVVEGRRS